MANFLPDKATENHLSLHSVSEKELAGLLKLCLNKGPHQAKCRSAKDVFNQKQVKRQSADENDKGLLLKCVCLLLPPTCDTVGHVPCNPLTVHNHGSNRYMNTLVAVTNTRATHAQQQLPHTMLVFLYW